MGRIGEGPEKKGLGHLAPMTNFLSCVPGSDLSSTVLQSGEPEDIPSFKELTF